MSEDKPQAISDIIESRKEAMEDTSRVLFGPRHKGSDKDNYSDTANEYRASNHMLDGNDISVSSANGNYHYGDKGDDILVQNAGDALMFGGEGKDTFVINQAGVKEDGGSVKIMDFDPKNETIVLTGYIDAQAAKEAIDGKDIASLLEKSGVKFCDEEWAPTNEDLSNLQAQIIVDSQGRGEIHIQK